ncbi:hypothetical protein PV387_15520 [Streptomyces sp. ME02-6987-2C]|uniref:DUF6624 domain-containing protein n=1 Tax=unclassified Streptomyces TaxID=2593676 RepID=UPI00087C6979|nr:MULTISPECIES: DUF6624 domain-containing protein [unclassified Streptomyces]MDX3367429.1 hypothetical protein [Streptomyces sp. ME02-6987-2C]MDX3423755.1 hypothetical protein [Streptomyces sp. ME02-6985-2c]REH20653.1 hypothetical protein BX268_2437 [Streptomyces sp. 2221.1]SDT31379.1 hypothetical protein SAMN05428941_2432 [Streptomyces sp. 2114.2]
MTIAEPQRPDLARELIARAQASAEHRAKRLRSQLDAVQLGRGRHADHANTKFLGRVLGEYEWPGHRLVGPAAARAAWSIALHSDHDLFFQRAATRLLERAVQADDAFIYHWAHLYDRTLINTGREQEFGTQLFLRSDGVELCPLRAPESLDERRASVGLIPIAVAMNAVRRRYAPGHRAEDALAICELANAA